MTTDEDVGGLQRLASFIKRLRQSRQQEAVQANPERRSAIPAVQPPSSWRGVEMLHKEKESRPA